MIGLYCGSFDPIHLGHIDIIKRASFIFEDVVVVIATNISKKPLLTDAKKLQLVKESISKIYNINGYPLDAIIHDGLTADLKKIYPESCLIRGIRNGIDLEAEKQLESANKHLAHDPDWQTVFFTCSPEYSMLSSSMVREFLKFNHVEDVVKFVPEAVYKQFIKE